LAAFIGKCGGEANFDFLTFSIYALYFSHHLLPRRELDPFGRTTGCGEDDLTHRKSRSIKEIFVLTLTRRFRELLSQ
jgi:hypothetical protein